MGLVATGLMMALVQEPVDRSTADVAPGEVVIEVTVPAYRDVGFAVAILGVLVALGALALRAREDDEDGGAAT